MKEMMNKDKWEKTLVIENREFRIKFWYDRLFGGCPLFYTSIEEKVQTKKTWYNKKGYYYQPIRKYWIDETKQNPIELALKEIQSKLNDEKELDKLEKVLDKFCEL
jgi:hypothetical protein